MRRTFFFQVFSKEALIKVGTRPERRFTSRRRSRAFDYFVFFERRRVDREKTVVLYIGHDDRPAHGTAVELMARSMCARNVRGENKKKMLSDNRFFLKLCEF